MLLAERLNYDSAHTKYQDREIFERQDLDSWDSNNNSDDDNDITIENNNDNINNDNDDINNENYNDSENNDDNETFLEAIPLQDRNIVINVLDEFSKKLKLLKAITYDDVQYIYELFYSSPYFKITDEREEDRIVLSINIITCYAYKAILNLICYSTKYIFLQYMWKAIKYSQYIGCHYNINSETDDIRLSDKTDYAIERVLNIKNMYVRIVDDNIHIIGKLGTLLENNSNNNNMMLNDDIKNLYIDINHSKDITNVLFPACTSVSNTVKIKHLNPFSDINDLINTSINYIFNKDVKRANYKYKYDKEISLYEALYDIGICSQSNNYDHKYTNQFVKNISRGISTDKISKISKIELNIEHNDSHSVNYLIYELNGRNLYEILVGNRCKSDFTCDIVSNDSIGTIINNTYKSIKLLKAYDIDSLCTLQSILCCNADYISISSDGIIRKQIFHNNKLVFDSIAKESTRSYSKHYILNYEKDSMYSSVILPEIKKLIQSSNDSNEIEYNDSNNDDDISDDDSSDVIVCVGSKGYLGCDGKNGDKKYKKKKKHCNTILLNHVTPEMITDLKLPNLMIPEIIEQYVSCGYSNHIYTVKSNYDMIHSHTYDIENKLIIEDIFTKEINIDESGNLTKTCNIKNYNNGKLSKNRLLICTIHNNKYNNKCSDCNNIDNTRSGGNTYPSDNASIDDINNIFSGVDTNNIFSSSNTCSYCIDINTNNTFPSGGGIIINYKIDEYIEDYIISMKEETIININNLDQIYTYINKMILNKDIILFNGSISNNFNGSIVDECATYDNMKLNKQDIDNNIFIMRDTIVNDIIEFNSLNTKQCQTTSSVVENPIKDSIEDDNIQIDISDGYNKYSKQHGNKSSSVKATTKNSDGKTKSVDQHIIGNDRHLASIKSVNNNNFTTLTLSKDIMKSSRLGYKIAKTSKGDICLITLLLPNDAKVVFDAKYNKYRTDRALVLNIQRIFYKGSKYVIEQTNEEADIICSICKINEITHAARPCKHGACMTCWMKMGNSDGLKCHICRAFVNGIEEIDKDLNKSLNEAYSCIYANNFVYKLGSYVNINNFDINQSNSCGPGLHYQTSIDDAMKWIEYTKDFNDTNNKSIIANAFDWIEDSIIGPTTDDMDTTLPWNDSLRLADNFTITNNFPDVNNNTSIDNTTVKYNTEDDNLVPDIVPNFETHANVSNKMKEEMSDINTTDNYMNNKRNTDKYQGKDKDEDEDTINLEIYSYQGSIQDNYINYASNDDSDEDIVNLEIYSQCESMQNNDTELELYVPILDEGLRRRNIQPELNKD